MTIIVLNLSHYSLFLLFLSLSLPFFLYLLFFFPVSLLSPLFVVSLLFFLSIPSLLLLFSFYLSRQSLFPISSLCFFTFFLHILHPSLSSSPLTSNPFSLINLLLYYLIFSLSPYHLLHFLSFILPISLFSYPYLSRLLLSPSPFVRSYTGYNRLTSTTFTCIG